MKAKASKTAKVDNRSGGIAPWLLSALLVGFVLLSAGVTGKIVGSMGLRDVDTCWILASGREMFESHRLLPTDPFSYTFQGLNQPLVMHQWLSEVIFYCVYRLAGLAGLVYFCTFVITAVFTCIPVYLTTKLKKSYVIALIVIALAPLSSLVRFMVRPELLAFPCLAVWLILLDMLRKKIEPARLRWRLIAGFALVMLLWTNLHSSFVLGVCLMLYFAAESVVGYFIDPQHGPASGRRFDFTAILALVVTACATLCNPYGIGLIVYVKNLLNSPLKMFITEMTPIAPEDLAIPLVWPFLAVLLVCGATAVRALSKKNSLDGKLKPYQLKFSALLMVAMVIFAFSSRRYISFCVLTLMYEIFSLYANRADGSLVANINNCLARLGIQRAAAVSTLIFAAAFIGAGLGIAEHPVTLPPQVTDFVPPFAALKFIDEHQPPGNLFNDSEFGSMLTWYRPKTTKVFIDSRFDMYGFEFVNAFEDAMRGQGYEDLFARYKISWLFLKPDAPLLNTLSRNQWRECYRDTASVILVRH